MGVLTTQPGVHCKARVRQTGWHRKVSLSISDLSSLTDTFVIGLALLVSENSFPCIVLRPMEAQLCGQGSQKDFPVPLMHSSWGCFPPELSWGECCVGWLCQGEPGSTFGSTAVSLVTVALSKPACSTVFWFSMCISILL